MTRSLVYAAFVIGVAIVGWIAARFYGTDLLALAVTVVIGAVFVLGYVEQLHFRRATAGLVGALDGTIDQGREHWLAQVPPSLRAAVHRRLAGMPSALPGPAVTPYLVGLLVMLGLLGTFAGMVVTLQGAVSALEGTTELSAMREGLTAPMQGLSLAFGTSVAGVAASAMLGLISTLNRRERQQVSDQLDMALDGRLTPITREHQRQQTFAALQSQADAVPALVSELQQVARATRDQGDTLAQQLTEQQHQLHQSLSRQNGQLVEQLGQALSDSLTQIARGTAEHIAPALAKAVDTLSRQAEQALAENQRKLDDARRDLTADLRGQFEQQLSDTITALEQSQQHQRDAWQTSQQQQAEALQGQWHQLSEHWAEQLQQQGAQMRTLGETVVAQAESQIGQQRQHIEGLLSQAETLLSERQAADVTWQGRQAEQFAALMDAVTEQLSALRQQEASRSEAAAARFEQMESHVAEQLTRLGQGLEAPMTRLINTASETPKAAAEVIVRLREEMASASARDNALLDERKTLIDDLNGVLATHKQVIDQQAASMTSLVDNSAAQLGALREQLQQQLDVQTAALQEQAESVGGSADMVAALSDTFTAAVGQFAEANQVLVASLERVDSALNQASQRNDEQLGYYVAQAKDLIDMSLMSQKEVIDALDRLQQQPANEVSGA